MVKTQVEDFPCYECLCLAVCKQKSLLGLYRKCEHFAFFVDNESNKDIRSELYKFLQVLET